MLQYPRNVPAFNQWRFMSLDSVDEDDLVTFVGTFPRDITKLVFGALSLLYEPECWTEGATLTPDEMVDICVKYVECAMWDCQLVADCISSSEAVQEALRDFLADATTNYEADNVVEDNGISLDCVWGGCLKLVNHTNDEILTLLNYLGTGADYLEDIFTIFPAAKVLGSQTFIAALAGFVISTLITIFDDPDYVESRACDLFCLQIATDNPLVMLPSTIDAWLDSYVSIPVDEDGMWMYGAHLTGDVSDGMLRRFAMGIDECDADWRTLCGCLTTERVNVDTTTSTPTVSSMTLSSGVRYLLSIHDTFVHRAGANNQADGFWYQLPDDGVQCNTSVYMEYRLNGVDWIRFPDMEYNEGGYTFEVIGVGNTIAFRWIDPAYGDNSGTLDIDIVAA